MHVGGDISDREKKYSYLLIFIGAKLAGAAGAGAPVVFSVSYY